MPTSSFLAPDVTTPQAGHPWDLVDLPPVELGRGLYVSWKPEHKGRFFDEEAQVWRGEERYRAVFRVSYSSRRTNVLDDILEILSRAPLAFRPFPTALGGYEDVTYDVLIDGSITQARDLIVRTGRLEVSLISTGLYRKPFDQGADVTGPNVPWLHSLVAGDGEIDFQVDLPGEGETTMIIYRGTAPGASVQLSSGAPATTYNDGTTVNGTRYYYRARLQDAAGNLSAFSNEVSGIYTEAGAEPLALYWLGETAGGDPEIWQGTIEAGALGNEEIVYTGTGDSTTGAEWIQAGIAATTYGGETWLHFVDTDVPPGWPVDPIVQILRRVKIDGTGFETIADLSTETGLELEGGMVCAVDPRNGDSWVVVMRDDAQIDLYLVTLAGVVTLKKVVQVSGNVGFDIQIDADTDTLALSRVTELGLPTEPTSAVDIYDMTGDFSATEHQIASDYFGFGSSNTSYGPAMLLLEDSVIVQDSEYILIRYDRTTWTPMSPNPWMDFGGAFVPAKLFIYGGEYYAIGYNDATIDPEIRHLPGDGGAGTVVTGVTTDMWLYSSFCTNEQAAL